MFGVSDKGEWGRHVCELDALGKLPLRTLFGSSVDSCWVSGSGWPMGGT